MIRTALPEEFDSVGELMASVYVGEGFSLPEAADRLKDVAGKAETADLLVAIDDQGELVGSIFLVLDGPLRQVAEFGEAEVRTLCVHPSARRKGWGEKLMKECVVRATSAGKHAIVLSTQPTMVAAHKLYEKLGFEQQRTRDWKRGNGAEMRVYSRKCQR